MPGGYIFGIIFFVLLTIAALTSSISLLEPVVAYFREKGFTRFQITVVSGVIVFLLGIPSSLSMGIWGDVKFFNKGFLDLFDFATANIMLPLGGMLISLFVGWVIAPLAIKEVSGSEAGSGLTKIWIFILRFVAPIAIAAILINGLIN
jgi:NSS family neurotransmitter:Na+ symporter